MSADEWIMGTRGAVLAESLAAPSRAKPKATPAPAPTERRVDPVLGTLRLARLGSDTAEAKSPSGAVRITRLRWECLPDA